MQFCKLYKLAWTVSHGAARRATRAPLHCLSTVHTFAPLPPHTKLHHQHLSAPLDSFRSSFSTAAMAQCQQHAQLGMANQFVSTHPACYTQLARHAVHAHVGSTAQQCQHEDGGVQHSVLYRGRFIRGIALLVRMKVLQLTGFAAAVVPITAMASAGDASWLQFVVGGGVVFGTGVATAAMWFYARRYVGELSLLRARGYMPAVRFSTLDFWGAREDNDVALQHVVPPLRGLSQHDMTASCNSLFLPIDVDGDRQYFISLPYGHIHDGKTLMQLLTGKLLAAEIEAYKQEHAADDEQHAAAVPQQQPACTT